MAVDQDGDTHYDLAAGGDGDGDRAVPVTGGLHVLHREHPHPYHEMFDYGAL